MIKFLSLISAILMLVLSGCSSSRDTTNNTKEKHQEVTETLSPSDAKNKAMEFFINGSIFETKGDYANAVLEFQDALKYDSSAGIYFALAKNYFYLRKIPQSLQYAKKSVELNPDQLEYKSLLADIFSFATQFDSAAAVLENMIAKDSTSLTSYYRLARIYEDSKPLSAIKIYKKLLNIIGADWSVLSNVANLYEKLGNIDEAANTVKELLKIDPGNNALYKLLVEYYTKSKEYDKALEAADDLLQLEPDDLEAREQKAQIYLLKDDWETAAKEYSYILSKPSVSLDTKIKIGRAYFAQSIKDSALTPVTKDFFEKIDKDTSNWEVKLFLGAIAINEHQDSAATTYFKDVTNLGGSNVQGWISLGGFYFDNKRYNEAIKVMNEAVQHFPDDFTVNLLLGLSLAQSNKSREARPYLEKAVQINPTDITALSAYGFTLNQLKEDTEAIKYLNKALQIDPRNVNLLGTLGLIYDGQKNWTSCDSVYERALSIDSANALVNNNYAYSLSERGIKLEQAFRMAQIALKAEPLNSSYLDTMGWIYFKLGKYEEAKEYIEKAIKVGGESSVILEHLGDVTFMLGNKDQAKKIWEKSYSLDSTNNRVKIKIEKGEI